MRDVNSLESWIFGQELDASELQPRAEAWLREVERQVEQPKPKYPYAGFSPFWVKLPRPLRERVEALFPRVWHAPGTGKHDTELSLLHLVGGAADPASIPFWKETVALSRARDAIAAKRREIAAAALAYMAVEQPRSGAFAALVALTEDEHLDARVAAANALAYLAVHEERVGRLAAQAGEALRRVARDAQQAFAPRFLALRFLLLDEEPLPAYERGDAIAFNVRFGRCQRTIELRADQTLDDLHSAILHAFDWDTDHLHQFSLNGDLRDKRFIIPDPDTPLSPHGKSEDPFEAALPLGAMGLPVGHELVYLYDFGDNNVFRIKVAAVRPLAPRAKYPRVTEKAGMSPEQYPSR